MSVQQHERQMRARWRLVRHDALLIPLQVRGSTEGTKRSFLERKGLTAAEIEAAFTRVPDTTAPAASAPASAPSAQPVTLNNPAYGANQLVTYQPHAGTPGYAPAQQAAIIPQQNGQALGPPQPEQQPIRWTQVIAGA